MQQASGVLRAERAWRSLEWWQDVHWVISSEWFPYLKVWASLLLLSQTLLSSWSTIISFSLAMNESWPSLNECAWRLKVFWWRKLPQTRSIRGFWSRELQPVNSQVTRKRTRKTPCIPGQNWQDFLELMVVLEARRSMFISCREGEWRGIMG